MVTFVFTLLFGTIALTMLLMAWVASVFDPPAKRRFVVAGAAFAGLAVWGLADLARGQDHHPLHKDFYRLWLQPGTQVSCCNARVELNGVETGDCEPVKAEVRAGNWWAWLRQESRWIEVPDSRIIRERNPEIGGQQGHLCYSYGRVLCFVPPDSGG